MDILEFENASALDVALVEQVVDLLTEAIEIDELASLVVSGGRTPQDFFHLLSQQALDWSKVIITLADERWVDPDHKDSNEKLVRENLLINQASRARFLPLKSGSSSAVEGEDCLEQSLSAIDTFTVVILGMGDDGHTASLFPSSEALSKGLNMDSGRSCIAVTPLEAPHDRMSMTLPRLLNSQLIIVHLCGQGKQEVLSRACEGDDHLELPIRAVLQQSATPVRVFWAR